MLDLHTHSTASDGTFTPRELIRLAKKIQLHALALCDHDTTFGIDEALAAATNDNVQFIPGVELSAEHNDTQVHIVGLYIDHRNPELQRALTRTRHMRNLRNPLIIEKLQEQGIDITMSELEDLAGGDSIGRPLIAQLLIQKKVVSTANAAFDKYLNPGGIAYIPKERLRAVEAINVIRTAGGIPILAHPHQTRLSGTVLSQFVQSLTDAGLLGIEVFCSGYKTSMSAQLSQLAKKFGLVRSGGSDFHGANKPRIRLGRGMGSLFVPNELLPPIKALATKPEEA